ncbi:hypothetical protein IFR04_008502 [Cadophora malorum]|uniref:Uncharacterized protein n=1 Tax=Cadophora malorum TaxID=108018 RepID=A0A8H7W5Y4_9HELO|nr:hypothetical protein IFR04_008502 [Cadophora malorum]
MVALLQLQMKAIFIGVSIRTPKAKNYLPSSEGITKVAGVDRYRDGEIRAGSEFPSICTLPRANGEQSKRGAETNGPQDLIVCLREDMPPKTDPNYRYLSSEPVELLQKFATQTLRHDLRHPHKCNSKDIENIMHLVPKKVNGMLEKKFGAVGWGVQAVPGLALWKCAIPLLLSQVPPIIFAIRWLLLHT